MRAAILHFYERLDAFMTPDFALLGSLTSADRWLVAVPDLHHHHFTSLGAASIEFPSLQDAIGATNATGEAYVSVARGTLEFLDAFVKQDSTARRHFHFGATWPHLGPMQEIVADATTPGDRRSTDDSTRIPNPARPRR